ncbi:MAG TPA: hypothetical protein VIG30_17950 [Ktedonobacterales bacterium]
MSLSAMPRFASLDGRHLSERVWDAAITLLSWLWRPLRWLVTLAVFIALLVVGLLWLAHALAIPLPDWRTLPILKEIPRHAAQLWLAAIAVVVLLPAAWWSHGARAETRAADDPRPQYDLQRARWLEPEDYIPRYIPRVYHWRRPPNGQQPDLVARQALADAARGRRDGPRGIRVVGRPLQGKTRLAWEAVQAVLPGWTLVRWAHSASRPFDIDAVRGQRVILWLDDLESYANPAEATTILDLPRLFAQAHVRLVIVATYAESEGEALVRARLGDLLDRLRLVRLVDLSATEADELGHELARAHVVARPAAFDGTPGSVVLDLPHLRDEVYPALPADARRALCALKLLRSAGIQTCSERRVRATAETAFGLPPDPGAWPAARDALVAAGYIRLGHARVAWARDVVPVAAAYLDQAVPDYPPPGRSLVDDWPRLRAGMTARHDAAGLFSLGNLYRERTTGDRMENLQHAEVCYWETLRICSVRAAPLTWAGAQSNLGITLAAEAQVVAGPEAIQMLAVAARAYRAAVPVYRRLRIWENWARTQTNLGLALRAQAGLVAEPQRTELLREAATYFRGVTRRRQREVAPTTPLRAQLGLTLIEREHAGAAAEVGRLRQWQTTIARLPALLPRGAALATRDTLPEHPAVPAPSPAMSHPRYPNVYPPTLPITDPRHAAPFAPPVAPPLAPEAIGAAASSYPRAPRPYPITLPGSAMGDASGADISGQPQPRSMVISEEIHTMIEEGGD